MITYEITAEVQPTLADAYERYMRETHIPDLLATGCFVAASLARSAPGRFRIRYEARSRADLDRYLSTHAAALRADFTAHFPEGVSVAREEWETLARWEDTPARPG